MPKRHCERKLSNISDELNQLSFRRQQLNDRRNVLNLLIEFKKHSGQNEEKYSKENIELKEIDKELKVLSDKKIRLQQEQDRLHMEQDGLQTEQNRITPNNIIDTTVSSDVFVGSPPSFPAPVVVIDVNELPRRPSQTQCPYCHQYITTVVSTSTGSVAFYVCLISILFGCVAGCCLIPFCVDAFKNVNHKCPNCRSLIHTCKKL